MELSSRKIPSSANRIDRVSGECIGRIQSLAIIASVYRNAFERKRNAARPMPIKRMAAQQLIVSDDTELKASSQMVCGITGIRASRTRAGISASVTASIVHLRNRHAHRCGQGASKRLWSCYPEGLASRYPLFKPPVFFQKFSNIEISAGCCMDPLAVCLIEPIQFPAFDICRLH